MKKAYEINFDGLVGPTHHYAGLSFGNEASLQHQHQVSNPKLAAKQGLAKMKALADRGLLQGVIPPQERPNIALLKQMGFSGSESQILASSGQQAPQLLSAASSASSMWVANAATVSPSADTLDGRVHFTVANLNSKLHRASEAETTERLLRAIFANERYFAVHRALPQVAYFGDEGAANHSRLCQTYGEPGIELFVYGRQQARPELAPQRYPARQTLEASQGVARLNQVRPELQVFAQQNPAVIDQGVFHNDVIAVANRQVLFCHEQAFLHPDRLFNQLREGCAAFMPIVVPTDKVSVADAVQTYLFNSQLISNDDDSMTLILPEESRQHPGVWRYLNQLIEADNPIRDLQVFSLQESMANGGGPACLRLRVVVNDEEREAINPAVMMNDSLFATLNDWVDRWYRDRLTFADLVCPQLLRDGRDALDELTAILQLGPVYPFQQ